MREKIDSMPEPDDAPAERSTKRRRLAVIALTVVAVAIAVYAALSVYLGFRREVHLVNGLPVTYEAVINGRAITLGPAAHLTVPVREGKVTVAVDGIDLPDGACSVTTPFWARPLARTVFVINPDRAGLLARITMTYTAGDTPAPPRSDMTLFAGERCYRFDGIDHPFEDFPPRVRAGGKDTQITRTGLRFIPDLNVRTAAEAVAERIGPEAARTVVTAHAMAQPNDLSTLAAVGTVLDNAEALALLRSRLHERPVLINWHRTWQAQMISAGRRDEVLEGYRERLKAEPDNAALIYLTGRAVRHPEEAGDYFRRAAEAEPPCAYAFHALAYQALGEARYADALAHSRRALELQPDSPLFAVCEVPAMLALGRYEALLKRSREAPGRAPTLEPVAAEVYLRMRLGERVAAGEAIDAFLARLAQVADETLVDIYEARLRATYNYLQEDRAAFADHALKGGDVFKARLAAGELDTAHELLSKQDEPDPLHALLLYIAAQHAGRADLAGRALSLAVEVMRRGRYDYRFFARRLAAADPPEADRVLIQPMLPDEKRVVLTAFGLRFPRDRAAYFGLARKLNTHRLWPYLLLRDVLAADEGTPSR